MIPAENGRAAKPGSKPAGAYVFALERVYDPEAGAVSEFSAPA